MSDEFTPQVRALLDRLEPPALSADFADRVIAQAETTQVLPPLPPLRKPRWPRGRRIALAIGVAGLVSVAAAAVVPADVWRRIPVISGIVELIAPAKHAPAIEPALSHSEPAGQAVTEPAVEEVAPRAEQQTPLVLEPTEAPPPVADRAIEPPAPAQTEAAPVERPRAALPEPVREAPVAERPMPTPTRPATVTETRVEPAPERIRPADTSELRQQTRERTTATRERTQQQRERRTARIN